MAMGAPPEDGAVAVMVRVRPAVPSERDGAARPVLHVVDQHILVFDPEEPGGPPGTALPARGPKHRGKDLKFVFDRVFGEGATQEEVFLHTTREVLDGVLNGYNCSVFAYGATGAGKTYTMLGSEQSPGIMYLTMAELYRRIEARRDDKSCEVLVSYQEVYNEQIHDLLEPKGPLAIREDPEKGVVVQGLSFHQPKSAEQLLEMLANGNKNRTQHPTDANATSSRSHAVFQIYVKQQDRVVGLAQDLRVAKMSLIDLAGSERASVTNTKGERLREGANINRSLLALINVINALADAKSKKTHIPYRDSKLTRLLKDSIGGNCRTIMIAAVSPSSLAYEDTYNTLKYANRAKEIKLSLKSNVLSLDCHISKYATICEQLKTEVADLRAKLRAYEDAAQDAGKQIPALLPSPRMEEAVPKSCSVTTACRESGGEQQELGTGKDAQLEGEEEVPEEMPPSSPTQQADLQLGMKKPNHLPQCLSHSHTDTLVATVLSVAQKQYSLLKAANLLTPDMVSEFEELQLLVQQEAAVSPEPTDTSGAPPALRTQRGCDASAPTLSPEPGGPMTRAALRRLQQLTPLSSPKLAVKKRRRSEMSNASRLETPHSLNMRAKRQRKSSQSTGGEAEAPQSPSPPCPKEPRSPQLPPCCTPKICPLTVTKRRVPLMTSAAQNCCTPTVCDLNVTYSLSEDVAKPGAVSLPLFPGWENALCALKKQEGPFVPRASIPAFSMKGSSIPKLSSVSKGSAQKRRRAVSAASRSLGGIQSRITSSSSRRPAQPQSIPERPPPMLTWKGQNGPRELAARDGAPQPPPQKP
ncbi:LOW QUALITY PROTEIN: kinesin-like protein KIF18B [Centrocercus urophasianus]|uniref:LOW QUALITY PROTEIN: kinesin-like protein KIF18B n=1 Tax=Centrocercus urophasianus TaxID=9002 RepID=UPI001C64E9B2|nr:LOW QUALITY PROTEIN: kinesin-like protein KIF18B [Centrocercus urophasianus]